MVKISEFSSNKDIPDHNIKTRCVICGEDCKKGGLWAGHPSQLERNTDGPNYIVVCGKKSCMEKLMQLIMDSLWDTNPVYGKLNDESSIFDELKRELEDIKELALSKKLSNMRLRNTIDKDPKF
jgi:hypothetical protein